MQENITFITNEDQACNGLHLLLIFMIT